ncbi:MAG: hypothetical protein Q8R79_07655 [Legionellaceae bacterium]|nr:hypothetical protein [Legionellaceae bacterium]
MDTTHYLAQGLGIILLVTNIGFAFHMNHYQMVFRELMTRPELKFITGMIPLIAGTILVLMQHDFHDTLNILTSVVCLSIFLKGVLRIVFPECSDKMFMRCVEHRPSQFVCIVISLIIGAALCYYGFDIQIKM